MAADFKALLEALTREAVDFIVIGGVAVVAHGYPRLTVDLDICYSRASNNNLERLVRALAPLRPSLRGAPPDLPFLWDARTVRSGLNFTLMTTAGDIDLLGEVTGVGGYLELLAGSVTLDLYGHAIRMIGLEELMRSKRAAGRAKDLLDLAGLDEVRRRQG